MKLSEHIKQCIALQQHLGDLDPEILISVKDRYTVYGYDAVLTMTDTERPWEGTTTNRDTGVTRLTVILKEQDNKNPKITFRKP